MSIRVICPGCFTRFSVSEKFAGKSGPCPKCKKTITIPEKTKEVKVHEPESFGPKGKAGHGVLKPVFRQEASVSSVQITLIIAGILGYLIIALVLRWMVEDKVAFPDWLEFALGLLLSLPLTFAGYTFLRNSELQPLRGRELWIRLGICAGIYGLLWLTMPVTAFTFAEYGTASWVSGFVVMIVVGAAVSSMVLELDFLNGIVHYGLYLLACVLGRWIAGLGALPGMLDIPAPDVTVTLVLGCDLVGWIIPWLSLARG